MAPTLPPQIAEALRALERGDVGPALAVVERRVDGGQEAHGGSPGPVATAWRTALAVHMWFAEPARGRLPAPTELDALKDTLAAGSDEGRLAIAWSCAALEKAAVLAFDRGALSEALALHRRLIDPALDGEAGWQLRIGEAWLALLAGADVAEEGLDTRGAAAKGLPAAVVIEATALRALGTVGAGDLDGGRDLARRAALMAQSEGLPQAEFLAHLVLSRVRRVTGKAHLATRILSALARVVSSPWRRWLDWERAFAASQDEAEPDAAPLTEPAALVPALLQAAALGDRQSFDHAASRLEAAAGGWADLAREARALAQAIDPTAPASAMAPELHAWCYGAEPKPPWGVDGPLLGSERGPLPESSVAFVVNGPSLRPRRILRQGAGLLQDQGEALRLLQTHRRQGRVDTALATLALAGEAGLAETDFFREVYRFPYVDSIHRGALDVLVHRMRGRLSAGARLDRAEGRLVLAPSGWMLTPDPRCAPSVDDRVLRLLATRGAATAKQAADALGVPLRTVQTALGELVSEGVLRREKQGANVEYRVEDTVFTEPSRPA